MRTRRSTICGCVAANACAIRPPSEIPTIWARAMPSRLSSPANCAAEVFDAVRAARHRRFAVAGQIVTDERQLARQLRDEIPEVPIDAEVVQQHEATAVAAAMQCDGRVADHGRV